MKDNGIDIISRIYWRWLTVLMEEMQGWANSLSRQAIDPAQVMDFLKQIGIDLSSLTGIGGSQMNISPYWLLGLDKSASDDQVKKRYRDLLRYLHPDTAGVNGTSSCLQMVLAAYEAIKQERGFS